MKPANLIITRAAAFKVLESLRKRNPESEFGITEGSIEEGSFDLDENGIEYEGGSYIVDENGDIAIVSIGTYYVGNVMDSISDLVSNWTEIFKELNDKL